MESALVLCEGSFGETMGKTGNGLVRYSKRYRIVGVLDSTKAGRDAGEVLDGRRNGIPIYAGVREALAKLSERPTTMIIGVATFGGYIPKDFRPVIREAIEAGLNVAAGVHEHLSEDPQFVAPAAPHGGSPLDVPQPRPPRGLPEVRHPSPP